MSEEAPATTPKPSRAKPFIVQRMDDETEATGPWVDVNIANGSTTTIEVKRAIKNHVASKPEAMGRYRILQLKEELEVKSEATTKVSFV